MINVEDLSLESCKKLKELENKLNKNNENSKKKKNEKDTEKNYIKLKSLEHSLPKKVKKKIAFKKIKNLNDLKKLTVTKKKKYFVKIMDRKDLKKSKT
ncbi:conserved protein, unknown function [Hepatocystis sp. ex Piliocolobus tephrosceles]|nr:conserved protein, unknown function [Hepatocystis sp. ex Piliocolobus tephrosceles]